MQHLQPNTTLQGGKYRIVLTKCLTHCEYQMHRGISMFTNLQKTSAIKDLQNQ